VRVLAVAVLLLVLLVLLGMSFLRINNLEYDVRTLAREVERLKSAAPGLAPVAPIPVPSASAAPHLPPATTPAPAVPGPAAAPAMPVEAVTRGFLDDGAEQQVVPLPSRLPRARVTILAIEGDGTGEKALPDPISFTLQAGIPQEVQGICQGPETAAWIFVLEPAAVRVTSRECEYPVRGLRPRLRISALP
jgi:hypothetical protein